MSSEVERNLEATRVFLNEIARVSSIKLDVSYQESLTNIGQTLQKIHEHYTEALGPLFRAIAEIYRDTQKADRAMEAGWVPYPGIPIALFEKTTPLTEIGDILEKHVRDDWPYIRPSFDESVRSSGVDQEALAAYREALTAHEAGLYRCVVRLLFPEIERVAREKLYDGERYEEHEGKRVQTTSLRGFREAVMHKLPAGLVVNSGSSFALVQKMCEHLYRRVGPSDENLDEFRIDAVPNRHASQHGYVAYSTHQNSFNMLAMTDFMFRLIMKTSAHIDQLSENDVQP